MKRFFLLPIILLSCSLPVETSFQSPMDICTWVHENIKYKPDATNYWQSPEETLSLKTGDCEDLAILMIQLCKEKLDIEGFLVVTYKQLPDKLSYHTVTLFDTVYDPTSGTSDNLYGYNILFMLSYNDLWLYGDL